MLFKSVVYMTVTCTSIKGSCVQCDLTQAALVFLAGSSGVGLDRQRVKFFSSLPLQPPISATVQRICHAPAVLLLVY
jgi:hypothetical protein